MAGQYSALKVLVADDNPHMRAIVTAILGGIDITKVEECADGAQALDLMRRWKPDIAIIDFCMDPVDGVEFTRLVRHAPDSVSPQLRIIMLTGYADKARVYEARDAGVNELIVKPITPRALIDRISAVLYKPRPFVRTATYFGPCRRRRDTPDFVGPFRRANDTAKGAARSNQLLSDA
jgi:CheY-like chemotaxis protein